MEFSSLNTELNKMTVLTAASSRAPLPHSQLPQASSVPEILIDRASMDHLDALEAQSIYILREAFSRQIGRASCRERV